MSFRARISAALLAAALSGAFCDDGALVRSFLKGSVSEKTGAVRASTGSDAERMAGLGIDFCLSVSGILGDDRDVRALALASVLALPDESVPSERARLMALFRQFPDETLRISVLEKLASSPSDSVRVDLVSLFAELSSSSPSSAASYLESLSRSGKIRDNKNLLPEIAENVLSDAIYSVEAVPDGTLSAGEPSVALMLRSFGVVAEAGWTRASPLVPRCFAQCVRLYRAGLVEAESFARLVFLSSHFPSVTTVEAIRSCLADCNALVEGGSEQPPEAVMLSLITALGELGDKSAFDDLLYVTYLGYSDSVVAKARESLSRLRW